MGVFEVRRSAIIGAVFALTLFLVPVYAQYVQAPRATETYGSDRDVDQRDWSDDIPAHISFVQGSVTLERDGKLEPAEANVALLAGDRLRTRGGGRVEVLFADGSALTIDEDSELDLMSDSLVRLLDGRLRLSITRATTSLDYRVDAPAASVWIRAAGDYRVEARNRGSAKPEVLLTVLRGSAELVNENGRTLVRAGHEALATPDLAPSLPYAVNSAAYSEFDAWTEDQRDLRVGAVSTRYLPNELRYESGAFDNYGSWDYLAPYGNVWYPRVDTGWRPYYQGRWSYSAHFGWLWVGVDRWSWATHHYGRWGLSSVGWYWIPERQWSPAWVSWGNAPGYVSWCPLGWDGRPVIGFHSASGYYDPWRAWTIVPHRAFVPNIWVTQHIVVYNTIAPTIRTQFVERRSAPVVPTINVRNIDPVRSPTFSRGVAVPRNSPPSGTANSQEAWRERAVGSAAPRSDRAVAPTGGSARASDDRGLVSPSGRPSTTARPSSDNSASNGPSRFGSAVSRPEVPRVQVPRVEVPEVSSPDRPSRALPRGIDAGSDDRPSSGVARVPQRATQPNTPASNEDRNERQTPRAGVRVPSAEPPRSSPSQDQRQEQRQAEPDRSRYSRPAEPSPSRPAPPPQAEPDHARSRGIERTPPPQSSAPPPQPQAPSRSQRPEAGPPSNPPPPPPSARGRGGDDTGTAAPRSRGRGGKS